MHGTEGIPGDRAPGSRPVEVDHGGSFPPYLDRDGLAKYFPGMSSGSDSLTAYLLSIAGEAGREIPGDARTGW